MPSSLRCSVRTLIVATALMLALTSCSSSSGQPVAPLGAPSSTPFPHGDSNCSKRFADAHGDGGNCLYDNDDHAV
jgi:hypothetical protein